MRRVPPLTSPDHRYVSRANPRDNTRHVILSTASMRPMDFAAQLNVSLANGWGIVRTVADLCLKMAEGKYVLVKDPNKVCVFARVLLSRLRRWRTFNDQCNFRLTSMGCCLRYHMTGWLGLLHSQPIFFFFLARHPIVCCSFLGIHG